MAVMTLKDGTNLHYEVLGSGPAVALVGGGRRAKEWIRPLAERVADAGYQVIIHDRRNCGASDVVIERRYDPAGNELSEQEIWAEELHELLQNLGVLACWAGGTSAGCRVSLLLALRHPESVKGLLLWRITGGEVAARQLGHDYYEQFVEVAEKEGMEGVVRTPFFAERIEQNPANRQRLLGMDVKEFISIMRYWRTFFRADVPVVGATEEQLRSVKVPTLIVAGGDDVHPTAAAEKLHALIPGSEYHPPQWTKEESIWLLARPSEYAKATAEKVPPLLLSFLNQHQGAPVGR